MTPEGAIKKKLKAFLADYYQFWPVQTGYGKAGLDLYACVRGQFMAFETKAPGKKPTPRQALTIKEIRDAGGEVYVVDYEVPPLRAAVTGHEAWYPAHTKEGEDLRPDQKAAGDRESGT